MSNEHIDFRGFKITRSDSIYIYYENISDTTNLSESYLVSNFQFKYEKIGSSVLFYLSNAFYGRMKLKDITLDNTVPIELRPSDSRLIKFGIKPLVVKKKSSIKLLHWHWNTSESNSSISNISILNSNFIKSPKKAGNSSFEKKLAKMQSALDEKDATINRLQIQLKKLQEKQTIKLNNVDTSEGQESNYIADSVFNEEEESGLLLNTTNAKFVEDIKITRKKYNDKFLRSSTNTFSNNYNESELKVMIPKKNKKKKEEEEEEDNK